MQLLKILVTLSVLLFVVEANTLRQELQQSQNQEWFFDAVGKAFGAGCTRGGEPENGTCGVGCNCKSGLQCVAGLPQRCKAPGKVGEACHLTRHCASGLTCEAGSHVCRAPGTVGEACHLTRPCGSGLECHPFYHICQHNPRRLGERCLLGGTSCLNPQLQCNGFRCIENCRWTFINNSTRRYYLCAYDAGSFNGGVDYNFWVEPGQVVDAYSANAGAPAFMGLTLYDNEKSCKNANYNEVITSMLEGVSSAMSFGDPAAMALISLPLAFKAVTYTVKATKFAHKESGGFLDETTGMIMSVPGYGHHQFWSGKANEDTLSCNNAVIMVSEDSLKDPVVTVSRMPVPADSKIDYGCVRIWLNIWRIGTFKKDIDAFQWYHKPSKTPQESKFLSILKMICPVIV